MKPEQSIECYEHHMLLKNKLENIEKEFKNLCKNCGDTHAFLFGGIDQKDGHLSFVDKVNLIYETQTKMIEAQEKGRKFFENCFLTFCLFTIGAFVSLGVKIATIDYNSSNLNALSEKVQTLAENDNKMSIQLARLESIKEVK